jgi:lyso-ornithine lipid O-acyltransferase
MRAIKFFHHLYLVLDYFIHAYWIKLTSPDPIERRKRFVANTGRISRKFLKAFRISLIVKNPERLQAMKDQAYLLVANHTSYTDIIMLSSLENLSFITSVEMGNNYFLGPVTRMGGSLFTDRKRPVSLKREIENFSDAIRQGFKVVLFPEGTSTDGRTVKDFRKSLFQVALSAGCPILPVCIKYKTLDGKAIDDSNRDLVYWYGDMDFAPHFMKLLSRRIDVEIEILESIVQIEGKTRAELSDAAFAQIHTCYHS